MLTLRPWGQSHCCIGGSRCCLQPNQFKSQEQWPELLGTDWWSGSSESVRIHQQVSPPSIGDSEHLGPLPSVNPRTARTVQLGPHLQVRIERNQIPPTMQVACHHPIGCESDPAARPPKFDGWHYPTGNRYIHKQTGLLWGPKPNRTVSSCWNMIIF